MIFAPIVRQQARLVYGAAYEAALDAARAGRVLDANRWTRLCALLKEQFELEKFIPNAKAVKD